MKEGKNMEKVKEGKNLWNMEEGKNMEKMKEVKGTVSRDFCCLISLFWSYKRCPRAVLIFRKLSQSYCTFKMTPRYEMKPGNHPKIQT